jgi:GNAT superfamily N-acetyltransferase
MEKENKLEVNINESDYSVSFFIIYQNKISVSELTLLNELGKDYAKMIKNKKERMLFLSEFEKVDKVYYFSRLNVSEKLRGKRIGKILMEKTINFCKENNAMLINTVNPYGEMNLEQLNNFYEKSGMKLVNEDGLLIYSRNFNNQTKQSNLESKFKK